MVIIFILFISLVFAEDISLQIVHDRLQVGQSVELELELVDMPVIAAPQIVAEQGLSVRLDSPSPTRVFKVVNFKKTSILRYRYLVSALEEGEWRIGPVSVFHKGKSHVAKSVLVHVASKSNRRAQNGATVDLSNPQPFEGQVLIYEFKFQYHQIPLSKNWRPPVFSGFRKFPSLEEDQKSYSYSENGRDVHVFDLRVPLIAGDSGAFEISSSSMIIQVPDEKQQGPQFFGQMFPTMKSKNEEHKSEPVEGLIRALPDPEPGFTGLIGDFELHAEPSVKVVKVGESFSIALTLEGEGNLSGYQFPSLVQDDLQVYDDSPVYSAAFKKERIWTKVELKRALVPLKEGRLLVNPVSLTVFNPYLAEYELLQTAPMLITVEPGIEERLEISSFQEKKIKPVKQLRPPPERAQIHGEGYLPGHWVWLISLAPILIFAFHRLRPGSERSLPVLPVKFSTDPAIRWGQVSESFRRLAAYRTGKEVNEINFDDYKSLGEEFESLRLDIDRMRFGGEGPADLETRLRALWRKK